jgi:hypothetical protein
MGLRQPRKFCEPVIFGRLFLKFALKKKRSVTPTRCSLEICTRIHPLFIWSLSLVPSSSGGVDFVDCNPTLAMGHQHIIVVVDYFTKWVEAMHTVKYNSNTATFFVFNQIIARFKIPSYYH